MSKTYIVSSGISIHNENVSGIADAGFSFYEKSDASSEVADYIAVRKKKRLFRQSGILALIAVNNALKNGNIDLNSYVKENVGLFLGESLCGFFPLRANYKNVFRLNALDDLSNETFPNHFNRTFSFLEMMKVMPALPIHLIAAELGIQGYCKAFFSSANSGFQSVIEACGEVNSQRADLMFAGGTQSKNSPLEFKRALGYRTLENLPEYKMGDASAIIVLEKHTNQRGYCIGGGVNFLLTKQDTITESELFQYYLSELISKCNLNESDFDYVKLISPWEEDKLMHLNDVLSSMFGYDNMNTEKLHENYFSANGCLHLHKLIESNGIKKNALLIEKGINKNYSSIVISKVD